jgi:CHAT domain-containing protein/tetratricopeptide (TPR) repeat protein
VTADSPPTDPEVWLDRILAADGQRTRALTREAVIALESDAPGLLIELKEASKAMLTVDPARALVLAEALLAGAGSAGLPWFAALGRMARGDAYSALGGHVEDALAELDAAAEAFEALDDAVAWARTRIGWIYLRTVSGAADEADFRTAERARRRLADAGEAGLAFTMDRNLIWCHWHRGQLDRADACFERALAVVVETKPGNPTESGANRDGGSNLAPSVGDSKRASAPQSGIQAGTESQSTSRSRPQRRPASSPGPLDEAWLRANRGLMLTSQARLTEAMAEHRHARDIFEQLGQAESLRRQEHNLGHLCLAMGDLAQALGHFYAAMALTDKAGLALPRGLVLANIARCHLGLGSLSDGLAEARQALTILETQGAGAEALRCRLDLARGLAALRTPAAAVEAETILNACLADPRLPSLRAQDGMAHLDLAELALRRGDSAAAGRWAEAARERFRAGRLDLLDQLASLVAAEAALAAGKLDLARAAVESQSAELLQIATGPLLPRALHLQARLAAIEDRDEAARQAYVAALDALDEQGDRLPPLLRTHLLDARRGLLADALECYRKGAEVDALWWMLERCKARAGAGRRVSQNPHLSPDKFDTALIWDSDPASEASESDSSKATALAIQLRHAEETQSQLFGLRHAPDWLPDIPSSAQPERVDPADLDHRLATAEAEVLRLREQLALAGWQRNREAAAARRFADWQAPQPEAGTVLAAFGLAAEPFVILAREDRRAVVTLPTSRAELGALAQAWHEAVEDAAAQAAAGMPAAVLSAPLETLLGQLHRAIVGPWQGWLDGAIRLVLLPYGALHGLPFGALYDGRRHLIEDLVIGTAPSAAWWKASRNRVPAGSRCMIAAFSHGGALPGAAEEAVAVAEILGQPPLLEEAATRDAVLAGADGAGLLHLAAHAAARPDRPAFAHLWLAGERLLSSHDLAGLDLLGAVVTLSGCETSRGHLTGSDEVLSLGRACLLAGASSVLGTLWPLSDAAALPQMQRFYQGMVDGLAVGAALRQAQLEAMRGDWPSPIDWAAYQCQGSCDTMLSSELLCSASASLPR